MRAKPPELLANPQYLKAFTTIMSRIERSFAAERLAKPIIVCIAGGAAMHFYTGGRFSNDIDAKFLARVLLDPADLQVAYSGEEGRARMLYLDTQYNDTFALTHAEAYDDALAITLEGVDSRRLDVRLLTPLDLAVSKLARFSEQDQEDIRVLAAAGLIDAKSLRRRAEAALPDYVGNMERINNSIGLACGIVSKAGGKRSSKS